MSKQSVFKKQLYEEFVRSSPTRELLSSSSRDESLRRVRSGVRSRQEFYEEDIAVGSQCEVKTLRARQCVIICKSYR
jgi:hypothetical protein